MDAGRFTKRLTIQSTTQSQDGFGEPDDSWGTYATRWAEIEYEGGGEALQAGTERTELRARIRMRYDSLTAAITGKMRATLGSTVFWFETPAQNLGMRNEVVEVQAVVRG